MASKLIFCLFRPISAASTFVPHSGIRVSHTRLVWPRYLTMNTEIAWEVSPQYPRAVLRHRVTVSHRLTLSSYIRETVEGLFERQAFQKHRAALLVVTS